MVAIITYAASRCALEQMDTSDPYPTLQNLVDNRSALQWSRRAARSSPHAQALGRVLSNLLITSPLALSSEFIAGEDNALADRISRSTNLTQHTPEFLSLLQEFPRLRSCQRFVPSPELLSALYSALSVASAPKLTSQVPLGHITPYRTTG